MTKLVLIDGSSYLYRAFHALPPLSNAAGEPTGALFGVVNMLRGHLKEAPEHIAFVLDASGPTFRDALFPAYKAQRPPMPDELRAQVAPMMAIVQALGIPLLREAGVEADDVIGTLAVQGAAQGMQVVVSTSDKDMAQLVRPGIKLVNTMSGSTLDSDAAVLAKFGVRADQIIDFLALMGDAVDNIPGVPKCGPKTAAKWLAEYHTLDGVIANAGKIGGKIGESLREALPRLPLNRTLTTIKTDVALEQGPQALALRTRDVDALRDLYARYGFNQALKELNGGATSAIAGTVTVPNASGRGFVAPAQADTQAVDPALSAAGNYTSVLTAAQLHDWVTRLQAADAFAIDTETDSLDPLQANLVGISLCVEPGTACYIPLA
ncbi:MAG: polymerase, partial [Pseudomonadota bacterium]